MKLLSVLLLAMAAAVEASKLAGPYQTAFFYFAYRMEVSLKGHGKTEIAPGCKTNGGVCNIDDFVKHIQAHVPNRPPFTGTLGLGDKPSVKEVVDALQKANYSPDLNQANLLKSWPPNTPGTFDKVWTRVSAVVQESREELQKKGLDPDNGDDDMKKLKECIQGVIDGRREEQAGNMLKFFKAEAVKRLKVQESDVPTIKETGKNYDKIDTGKLVTNLKAAGNLPVKKEAFITDFVKDYNSGKFDKTGAKGASGHFKTIVKAKDIGNDLGTKLAALTPCTT
ncbi:exocyst complex component sec5 domain-containing protein [Purpureocillium lilacinum]|uniref:Exocyst complex component sec5 domain-containing protein n=1 Tax=Purpureocillium lilacinum TaxID=33203 RepID=A0A179H4X5_PURLI|nr:exocyst complex component sec5 domain-containing protein [Purpureocillium lilacinum]OAQ77755.1 exocyst complex component sec5 domain-containing protein [Purpureocillium lilacinum]OAQ85236.1 exocyst complex component sec5 domain-containing protein [Purpureocillium lilacinum]